jgi:hypothetical protein
LTAAWFRQALEPGLIAMARRRLDFSAEVTARQVAENAHATEAVNRASAIAISDAAVVVSAGGIV